MTYRYSRYTPLLGEPLLRLRIGKLMGQVTVPVLLEKGRPVIDDSVAIARHADRSGQGASLFPPDKEDELVRWLARGDRLLKAGRGVVLGKMSSSRDAQAEVLPPAVPRPLRSVLAPMSGVVTRYMSRKYDAKPGSAEQPDVIDNLEALRDALRGGDTLAGGFSYADIMMACALQFVRPVSNAYMRLTPALRVAWTCAELASKYSDVIEWRDAIYAKHRRVAS